MTGLWLAVVFPGLAAAGDPPATFDDLVRRVARASVLPPGDLRSGESLTDEAIARRKRAVLAAAAEDPEFRYSPNPKYQFPELMARLAVGRVRPGDLDYLDRSMKYRGPDDTFSKSSLSRIFCQFGDGLPAEIREHIRAEATGYPGFFSGGTENHVVMRRTSGYLFGERFAEDAFQHGLSGRQVAAEMRDYFRRYGHALYDAGMVEYLSPIYHAVHTAAWLNVVEFAGDDSAGLMARAILDWMMADYAVNYYGGIIVPPVQREKGFLTDSYQTAYARSLSQWTGWLYWGGGITPDDLAGGPKYLPRQPRSLCVAQHAMSDWNPHPVLRNIGAKRLPGAYMLWQSRCNWGCVEPAQLNALGKKSVYHNQPCDPRYNLRSVYVSRNYALGASYRKEDILDPLLGSVVPFSVVINPAGDHNWLFAAHPFWYTHRKRADSDELLGDDDCSGVSPFMQMVHWENAAVVLWDIPPRDPYDGRFGKGSPKFASRRAPDLIQSAFIYVPQGDDESRQREGVFFLRYGPVYIAIVPVAPGAAWRKAAPQGYRRLHLPGGLTGFAVEVADQQEFASFDAFQSAITAARLDRSGLSDQRRVVYRSSRGHVLSLRHQTPGWLPDAAIDGVKLEFDRWPCWESPYITCRNRVLDINDGSQGFTIDWQGDLPEYTYYQLKSPARDP